MMSVGSGLTPTDLSPNASLGSLLGDELMMPLQGSSSLVVEQEMSGLQQQQPPAEDVDQLLNALEHATNQDSFAAKSSDASFVQGMLDSELPIAENNNQEGIHHSTSSSSRPPSVVAAVSTDKQLMSTTNDESFGDNLSLNGIPPIEPLSLGDMPSDPNVIFNLSDDQEFLQNSLKLDEFIGSRRPPPTVQEEEEEANTGSAQHPYAVQQQQQQRQQLMSMAVNHKDPSSAVPVVDFDLLLMQQQQEQQQQQAALDSLVEDVEVQNYPGKRRKAQRRGSLPTMHLNYYEEPAATGPLDHHTTSGEALDDPFAPTPIGGVTNLQPEAMGYAIEQERQQPTQMIHTAHHPQTIFGTTYNIPTTFITPEDEVIQPEKRRRAQRRGSLPSMHLTYSGARTTTSISGSQQQQQSFLTSTSPSSSPTGTGGGNSAAPTFRFSSSTSSHGTKASVSRMPRRGSTGSTNFMFSAPSDTAANISSGRQEQGQQQRQPPQQLGSNHHEPQDSTPSASSTEKNQETTTTTTKAKEDDATMKDAERTTTNNNNNNNIPQSLDPETMMKRLQDLMTKSAQSQKDLQQWDKKNGLPKSHSQTMVNSSRSRKQLQEGVILPKWDGTPLINKETELGKPRPRTKHIKGMEGGGTVPKHHQQQRRMSAPASSGYNFM